MVKITIKGLILGLIMFLFMQSFAWILPNKVFLDKDIARYIGANSRYESGDEIILFRTENTKTFYISENVRNIKAFSGPVHYKDDYSNPAEIWKNINLTWFEDKITKAPFELSRDNGKYTMLNKKTGKISTIEKLSAFPASANFNVVVNNDRVSFRHTLSSANIPFNAQFKVSGEGFYAHAFDDDGSIKVNTSIKDGVLTESIPEVANLNGIIRAAKGNIIVDPVWQVGASNDDASRRLTPDYWLLAHPSEIAGSHSSWSQYGSGMRFQNIDILESYIVTTAFITFTAQSSRAGVTVNTRLSGESVADASAFADDSAAFDTRWANRTVARVDWDSIPAWTIENEYETPELKPIIDEIKALPGWNPYNDLVFFWDDYADRSTHIDFAFRDGYSWDTNPDKSPVLTVQFTIPTLPDNPTNFTATRIGIDSLLIEWITGINATKTDVYISGSEIGNNVLTKGYNIYSGTSENVTVTGLSLDNVEYGIFARSYNIIGYSSGVAIRKGGEIMTSLGFLFGMIVLLIISMIWWKRGLLHILTLGYAIALGYMAAANGWDLVFIPVIVITGIISIILFIYAMTKGDWL